MRRLGYPLSEVARYFHRDSATVSTLISRLAERIGKDHVMRREMERLTKIVER